jgi:hypothetical protein
MLSFKSKGEKIMLSEKYVQFVKETMNKDYDVPMAILALMGEASEFEVAKSCDEYGDMLYQFVVLCLLTDTDISQLKYEETKDLNCTTCLNIYDQLLMIADMYKKQLTRHIEIDKARLNIIMNNVYDSLIKCCERIRFSKESKVMQAQIDNMAKLRERYSL